jgi:hypothetical protein
MRAGCEESRIHPRDGDYVLLDRSAVPLFAKRFAAWLWDAGLHYVSERWDCDDYALCARCWASLDHALHSREEAGLAFGECWYISDEGGHAINWSVHTNAEGHLELALWEPQVTWATDTSQASMAPVPLENVQRWLYVAW